MNMLSTHSQLSRSGLFALLLQLTLLTGSVAAQATDPCPPARCLPITITRLAGAKVPSPLPEPVQPPAPAPEPTPTPSPAPTPAPNPAPTPAPLSAPAFSPREGTYVYGSVIQITTDSLPPNTSTEYSTDGGTTWTVGNKFAVLNDGTYLARVRQGNRVSADVRAAFTVAFQRMLVVGNSILSNGPLPELGWLNSNGMAASSLDKDFYHLLLAKLSLRNDKIQSMALNIASYEGNFWAYDFEGAMTNWVKDFKSDLVIVRVSENFNEQEVNSRANGEVFRAKYRQLLDKLVQYTNSPKVVCSTSFWNNPRSSQIIREVAAERGYPVADIYKELYDRPDHDQFTAKNEYANGAVGAHPNDKGMAEIARLIWLEIIR